jgi:PPM family protein phosphatase
MGTTCVALVLCGAEAFLAHVGDSRAYRLRGGALERLTVDHSFVAELVAAGALTEEEARAHEQRNVITRALGIRPEVEPTVTGPLAVEPGDVFVLCSDGLHDPVRDEEIAEALAGAAPLAAAERLVALARERGGPDNITVAVAAVREASWRHPSASGAAPDPRATREAPALPAEAAP